MNSKKTTSKKPVTNVLLNGKQSKVSKEGDEKKNKKNSQKKDTYTDLRGHDLEYRILETVFDKDFFRVKYKVDASEYKGLNSEEQKIAMWELYLEKQEEYSPNSMFDVEYYLEHNENLPKGTNPFLHFISKGWKEGKDPHWLFDCNYYLSVNKDIRDEKMNPFFHFLEYGWKEKRPTHPLFDQDFYEGLYQDLKGSNLLRHYILYGYKERRNPSLFFNNDYFRKLYGVEADVCPVRVYLANPKKHPKTNHHFNGDFYLGEAKKIEKEKAKELREASKEMKVEWVGARKSLEKEYKDNLENIDQKDEEALKAFKSEYDLRRRNLEYYYEKKVEKLQFRNADVPLIHFILNIQNLFEASPSKYFNSVKYAEKYNLPEDGYHPLYDYMHHTNRPIFNVVSPLIQEQLIQAAKLDSKLIGTNGELSGLRAYELPNKPSELLSLTKKVFEILDEKRVGDKYDYDYIFTLSTLRRGGAELVVMKFLNAIFKYSNKKVLLIYTDKASIEAEDWLRDNDSLTVLDFHKLQPYASFEERGKILSHLIEAIRPDRVINTNSWVSWETYKQYGKSLSQITSIEACLFCYDYDSNGKKCGYPTDYFRDSEPYLNRVYTENKAFIKEMTKDFGLFGEKLNKWTLVYQPHKPYAARMDAKPMVERIQNNFYGLPKVFLWASRIHRQKCPDILIEIAKNAPDVIIEVWAPGNLMNFTDDDQLPENLIQKGEFNEFFDLPLHNKAGFLYTSAWDGIPTIIIDSLSAGLPVIAPNVGGISELINDETGWLIDDYKDVDAYVKAIEEVTTNADLVHSKLENAHTKLQEQHGYQTYLKTLEKYKII